jgi:hypothetical protein
VNRSDSNEGLFMTIAKPGLMLVCLMSLALETKEAKMTPLLSKDLTDFPGKEGLMDDRGVSAGQVGPNTPPQRTGVCLCA